MDSLNSIDALPTDPGIYALYGGKGRQYVAYVGLADNLRRRLKQHLVNRDSSVTTGTSAVGLNPDYIWAVEWWIDDRFSDRATLGAAELIAFDVLEPALRSRGGITGAAQALAHDAAFRAETEALLAAPTGRLEIPTVGRLMERLVALETRVAQLEAEASGRTLVDGRHPG